MEEIERVQPGNIMKPAHEQMDQFIEVGEGKVKFSFDKVLLHLSNQIYELHQSLYGWDKDKKMEDLELVDTIMMDDSRERTIKANPATRGEEKK